MLWIAVIDIVILVFGLFKLRWYNNILIPDKAAEVDVSLPWW